MSSDVPGWNEPEYPYRTPGANPAADRVKAPAVFLIIVGVVNLLLACLLLVIGLVVRQVPEDQFEKVVRENLTAEQKQAMEKSGLTAKDLQELYANAGTTLGVISLFVSVIVVFGGIRMIMMRSYGLAVVASILAAVPVLSCCSCPFLVGIGVGIWSLTVLFSADVRSAFR
jgi:hypothetical protein